MEQRTAESEGPVSLRVQAAVYGIGVFNTSLFQIGSVIIPLHAATMNPSPFMFGLVFAAAHVLPLFFSIHAGALMDRIGARRVMLFHLTRSSAWHLCPELTSGRMALRTSTTWNWFVQRAKQMSLRVSTKTP